MELQEVYCELVCQVLVKSAEKYSQSSGVGLSVEAVGGELVITPLSVAGTSHDSKISIGNRPSKPPSGLVSGVWVANYKIGATH